MTWKQARNLYDVDVKSGADLDQFAEQLLGVQRYSDEETDEEFRDRCCRRLRGQYGVWSSGLSALTQQEYLAQRKLLVDSQAALRKSGYSKTAEEYDEYIAELDQQWTAQGAALNGPPIPGTPVMGVGGVSGGTITAPPPKPGQVLNVIFNGKTWGLDPHTLKQTEEPATPQQPCPCAFCGTPTLLKDDKHGWPRCGTANCYLAADAQSQRVYAGLVDCEQTRKDALRWVEKGGGK